MKVPFVNIGQQYINLRSQIIKKFDQISKKGQYILGEELHLFEKEFSKYVGVKYSVGVGSGSDALTFSLLSLGIGKGDEVIIPVNSFVATAWTVANVGAKPVFCDVLDDFNINPFEIKKKINKRTKAIMPVHLTGRMANMNEIIKIAKENKLFVIEDAAQAIGASYKNKKAGSFGNVGCFSLHPLKNLHVHGDGGVITTNNKKLYEFFLKIRNHGLKNRNECEFWGYNSRLDNINAAIARIKLRYLTKWNMRFNEIAKKYSSKLNHKFIVPIDTIEYYSTYHRYIIMHENRNNLQKYLFRNNIETKINYPLPLHLHQASKNLGYKKGNFPKAEKQSSLILSIPIYAELSETKVDYIIDKMNSY
tara:strand:- start:587 stop:1675 length:1089 start_codon:yes stop_codon:yes gene_type:complete